MPVEKSPVDVTGDHTLRPRVGGRGGEVAFQRAPRFCRSVLIRAQLRFAHVAGLAGARPARKHGTRRVADVLCPSAGSRRCVVKARVVRMTGRGIAAARLHLAYIERDGVERDGTAGRLYGSSETPDRAAVSEAIPGERHQFRFIVSPEDGVDLTTFTRELMRQVERDLAVRLRWGAVNHYNTDHPHVHVVVRGVDQAGGQVWIDRAYISERMRWQAQHLLTDELGPRPQHEIERQLDREISQERLTSVDRRLAAVLAPDQTTDTARIAAKTSDRGRRRLLGRLQVLEQLRLATRTSPRAWRLDANWQTALRELGEREDIIERVHRALGDPARYRVIDASADLLAGTAAGAAPIVGVVRRKGLHDELRGDAYAVVESDRGEAAYVRLDAASVDTIPEGAIVHVAVERQTWAKPMDRALAQVARQNGGVYDPDEHLAALRRQPVTVAGTTVPAEAVIAANLRRLSRLERYKLVTRLDAGRWRVPPELVATLAARELSHPRRQVLTEIVAPPLAQQITRRAPCWLDEQDPAAPRAPTGWGAAVTAALESRARFLDRLGIPAGPRAQRLRSLSELEQLDIGRNLAAEHGATLVPPMPGMRGKLVACPPNSAGLAQAGILDHTNRRLALVPLSVEQRPLVGRAVTLSRDATGRLVVRPDGLTRGA